MAKHTLKEILGIFASGAGHTHEKAVQDTYDAGHAAGKAEAQAEFQAGLGSPAPAPAIEGSTDENEKATKGQTSEEGQASQTAAT
jgi:hypothetical protein